LFRRSAKNEDHMTDFSARKASASLKPVPKVQASALAGAVITIILYIFTLFKPDLEINVEVVSAVTTLLSFVAGYMTPTEGYNNHEEN
jgi:hypothetical protein